MSIACVALLSLALAAAEDGDKKTVENAASLTNRFWVTQAKATERGVVQDGLESSQYVSTKIYSLRPGEQWSSGEMWILERLSGVVHLPPWRAWKARYTFYGDQLENDILLLKVGPTRSFTASQVDQDPSWTIDNRHGVGTTLELNLEAGAVPTKSISVVPSRFFYVDAQGVETAVYGTRQYLGGLIRTQGEKQDAYSPDFLHDTDVFELLDIGTDVLELWPTAPPPGFFDQDGVFAKDKGKWRTWRTDVLGRVGLVDRRWYYEAEDMEYVLILQQGNDGPAAGSLWILGWGTVYGKEEISAWKGTYAFPSNRGLTDAVILQVRISRRYYGRRTDDKVRWSVGDQNDAYVGAELEITADSWLRPGREVNALTTRLFYFDDSGKIGMHPRGTKGEPDELDFLDIGQIAVFKEEGHVPSVLDDSPPPGLRWNQVRHEVAKPVTAAPTTPKSTEKRSVAKTPDVRLHVDAWKHLENGEYLEAATIYSKILEADESDIVALQGRGVCSYYLGNTKLGIDDMTKALEVEPNSAFALCYRATFYRRAGDSRREEADYRRALEVEPRNTTAMNGLAWLLATCRDGAIRNGKEAVERARSACALADWKNADYLDTLATSFAEVGDFDEAVRWQTKAIDLWEGPDKSRLVERLELFKQRKPYRGP